MIAKSSGSAATDIPMVDEEGALTLYGVSAGVDTGDPAAVLDMLRDARPCNGPLPESCRELMRAARLSGASWHQIGDAVEQSGAQARRRFVQSISGALEYPASEGDDFSDEELMDLAVAESRAVRHEVASR